MQIKSIKLRNIRSYTSQRIDFPEGPVLLSGDIGSGKSTILLAVEFALFGVRKPYLSGSTLLRKGAGEGSVELRLEIDKKEVIIRRNLKKSRDEIKQESGFIMIDGIRTDATAVELKSRVIDLLGYPRDLLTKHRDIIYRYTVYTPQEEMKSILFEDSDARLNTLRKVFGIDRYKRIRENCVVYIRALKDRIKEYTGRIYDLEEKQRQKKEKDRELARLIRKLSKLIPDDEKIKKKLDEKKKTAMKYESRISELSELKKRLAVCEADLSSRLEQRKANSLQLEKTRAQIQALKKELPAHEIDIKKTAEDIALLEKDIAGREKELNTINSILGEYKAIKSASSELLEKVTGMKHCPVCKQDVTESHKKDIAASEHKKMLDVDRKYAGHLEKQKGLGKSILELKEELQKSRAEEKRALLINSSFRRLQDMAEAADSTEKQQDQIKKQVGKINMEKKSLGMKLDDLKDIEEQYARVKKELDELLEADKRIDRECIGLENKIEAVNSDALQLEDEIKKKLEEKSRIRKITELQHWLEEYFINLMVVTEKHIMSRLYSEFNESFVDWFNTLIADESISIRLDDEFSPVIEQNGYETELESLSGGEKTSVALAYRLALNKVINDYISHIKTRDIIILDEPTDGFSNEQLDKVRDVLEQLNVSQIIIVSHESKIESFVDNVIRVFKVEHSSRVENVSAAG